MADKNKENGKKDEVNQEFDNFQRLLKQVLSAPKEQLDKERADYEQEKAERQTR